MFNIFKNLLFFILTLWFTGCGSDGGSTPSSSITETDGGVLTIAPKNFTQTTLDCTPIQLFEQGSSNASISISGVSSPSTRFFDDSACKNSLSNPFSLTNSRTIYFKNLTAETLNIGFTDLSTKNPVPANISVSITSENTPVTQLIASSPTLNPVINQCFLITISALNNNKIILNTKDPLNFKDGFSNSDCTTKPNNGQFNPNNGKYNVYYKTNTLGLNTLTFSDNIPNPSISGNITLVFSNPILTLSTLSSIGVSSCSEIDFSTSDFNQGIYLFNIFLTSGSGKIYSDAQCQTPTKSTSIPSDTSGNAKAFFKDDKPELSNIQFSVNYENTPFLSDIQNITTIPQTLSTNFSNPSPFVQTSCVGMTVTSNNSNVVDTINLNASLSDLTTPSHASFFSDSACTSSITSVNFSNATTATFYIKDTSTQAETVYISYSDSTNDFTSPPVSITFTQPIVVLTSSNTSYDPSNYYPFSTPFEFLENANDTITANIQQCKAMCSTNFGTSYQVKFSQCNSLQCKPSTFLNSSVFSPIGGVPFYFTFSIFELDINQQSQQVPSGFKADVSLTSSNFPNYSVIIHVSN